MNLQDPLGSFSPGMDPSKDDIFFLIVHLRPLQKNSGLNPMSFQFLTRDRLTQV